MTTNITTRQAGILIAIAILSMKLITFPSLYAKFSGIEGWLAIAINTAIDLVFIFLILRFMKKRPNQTFNDVITETFGSIGAKILSATLAIFFTLKLLFMMSEHQNYLGETLFTYLSWPFYFVPLMGLLIYFMTRKLRGIARCSQIVYPLVIVALIVTFAIPMQDMDFSSLLPFFDSGIGNSLNGATFCIFSAGDFFILFMLMGRVQFEGNTTRKLFNYALFASIIVVLFYMAFFSVFRMGVVNQTDAIGDLPFFASLPSTIGRIDWITISLWTIGIVTQMGLLSNFIVQCLMFVFGSKKKALSITIVVSALAIEGIFMHTIMSQAVKVIVSPVFVTIIISYQAIMFLMFIVAAARSKGGSNEFSKGAT